MARRHLTTEQKRALVTYILKQDPKQSDRQAGKKAGMDHKTVSRIRKESESTGEIPQLKERTGADGKTRQKPTQKSERNGKQSGKGNAEKTAKPATDDYPNEQKAKALSHLEAIEKLDFQAMTQKARKEILSRLKKILKKIEKQ